MSSFVLQITRVAQAEKPSAIEQFLNRIDFRKFVRNEMIWNP